MKRFFAIAVLVAFASSAALFAGSEVLGRDIVDRGTRIEVEGSLVYEDGEWALKTASETYDVHLGNYSVLYPEGLGLKDGEKATVKGFVVGDDISAVSLTAGEKTYAFRGEDGRPLWAGNGNGGAWNQDDDRRNRADETGRMGRGYEEESRPTLGRPMMGGRGR